MSGETWRAKNSQSSPTFDTMVTSEKGWTARRPWRKRAAPTPPARTVITAPPTPPSRTTEPENQGTSRGRGSLVRWCAGLLGGPGSRGGACLPELAGEGELADVVPPGVPGGGQGPG